MTPPRFYPVSRTSPCCEPGPANQHACPLPGSAVHSTTLLLLLRYDHFLGCGGRERKAPNKSSMSMWTSGTWIQKKEMEQGEEEEERTRGCFRSHTAALSSVDWSNYRAQLGRESTQGAKGDWCMPPSCRQEPATLQDLLPLEQRVGTEVF
jgi:hypothetical protein